MKTRIPSVICLLLCALSPLQAWEVDSATVLARLPGGAEVREVQLAGSGQSARMTAIVFSTKTYEFRVIDSPAPGTSRLAETLRAAGCVAGVNGGYFHENYRPVGLLVANEKRINAQEKAKLLSGIFAVGPTRREIVRSSAFDKSRVVTQAIQCGPMLVEKGVPVAGLNAERIARRTVVATDGRGHWALVYMTSVSLADAAKILCAKGALAEWTPTTALNLDGGRSSGLWATGSDGDISLPEFTNVRNFLGIVPK